MGTLYVISAGAAQSAVLRAGKALAAHDGTTLTGSFGAVGAQQEKFLAGDPADIVVLTARQIDELTAAGHIVAGSRADLGAVGSGVAVRAGAPRPDVSTPEALARALTAASSIHIPDPVKATAGIQFMKNCERLGIVDAVRPLIRPHANGHAAMTHMAGLDEPRAIGVTQLTEILFVQGVDLVAPVPEALQTLTTYSLGIATRAQGPAAAAVFAQLLTGPGAVTMLREAGFRRD